MENRLVTKYKKLIKKANKVKEKSLKVFMKKYNLTHSKAQDFFEYFCLDDIPFN